MKLVDAMARQEGFGKPGTRATRNHNPGNINYGKFAREHGALRADDKGYAVFPDDKTGFVALKALLTSDRYKGLTVRACLLRYCPPVGDPRGKNNTEEYIENVCEWLAITAETVIDAHV